MRRRLVLLAAAVLAVGGVAAAAVVLQSGGGAARHRAAGMAVRHPAGTPRASGRASYRPAMASRRRPPPAASRCRGASPPIPEHPITRPRWLSGVVITEYYPAPERWFAGRRVSAPGLPGTFAADWLYSARGLAMEGDGVDRRGRRTHIAELGSTGWVNAAGRPTHPVCLGKWSNGSPAWLRGGWRNERGQVTFPLAGGGWSNGRGVRRLPYGGVAFAAGPSLPVRYYHSIAVDPRLIPLGSRVYVPAYRHLGGGWFVAQDTGGAIRGRHIDVYRPAPATPTDLGRYLTGQRIYVVPPR